MSLRLLVVDDDMDTADSLAMLARLWGHTVRVAYNWEAALKAAAEFGPGVVLLDLAMPEKDGFALARELRRLDEFVRLIAVTGHAGDDYRERTREAGFHHHLVKPVDWSQLRALLTTTG
jgi:DNA-binding response OmpR family regulator